MFTCHEHMRDLFYSLGADVRILPRHKDVYESQATPQVYEGGNNVALEKSVPVVEQVEPIVRQTIPVEYVESGADKSGTANRRI